MITRLAIAALSLALIPADGHLLRPFVHKGDQWTTNSEFDLELSYSAAAAAPADKGEGGEKEGEKEKEKPEETSWKLARRDRFDSEVLEAKSDVASKLRRQYTRSTAKLRLKAGKAEASEKQEDTALHQANLVLEKDGDTTKIVSGAGTWTPEFRAAIDLDSLSTLFLPPEKTEEGKEWTVEGKKLAGFLTQQLAAMKGHDAKDAGGKLKVTLKSVKEEKGRKLAEIGIEGDVSFTLVTPKDAVAESRKLLWQSKGSLAFDATSSRPTRLTLEGKIEEQGGPTKGEARLTLEVEEKEAPSGAAMRLLARFHPGDVLTKTDVMKLDIGLDELTMLMNGKKMDTPTPEQRIAVTNTMKVTDEILEASEGKPKKLRREFQEVKFELKGIPAPEENPMEDLEGKAILVEEEGGEVHAKPDAGAKIDEKLIKGQGLGDEWRIFLPEEEVKKGSVWSPDEKKLAEMFRRMLPSMEDDEDEGESAEIIKNVMKRLSGSIECKLAGVSEEEGASVARITLKGGFGLDFTQDDLPKAVREGMGDGELEISASGKFEGEMLFDIKAGKPVKFGFSGPISLKVKIAQSNEEAGMDFQQLMRASGSVEMESGFGRGKTGK